LYKLPPAGFKEIATRDECGADLCVGPGHRYKVPSEAAAVAKAGQSVAISAGDYVDCAVWRTSVRIRGIGGRPHIHDSTCLDKAVWIVQGDETTIENVELSGGFSYDGNGNAIRLEGRRLVLRDCSIHHNQIGILTGHNPEAVLEVYGCEFHSQFSNEPPAHDVYAGRIRRFVATGNYIHDGNSGHYFKSVAAENEIVANLLIDHEGTEAALIDLWGCSSTLVAGNIMVKSGDTGNLNFVTLTKRGALNGQGLLECPRERRPFARLSFNTAIFENPTPRYSAFVYNHFGTEILTDNNIIVNTRDVEAPGDFPRGKAIANAHLPGPAGRLFVNPATFDFRLKRPIAAEPSGYRPDRQYRHPLSVERRTSASFIGAVEALGKPPE
jgi:hypothetical protein